MTVDSSPVKFTKARPPANSDRGLGHIQRRSPASGTARGRIFLDGVTPERLSEHLGIARTEAERSGRSPDRIEVTYLGAPNSAESDAADRAGVDATSS
jgi:hypothetical protein